MFERGLSSDDRGVPRSYSGPEWPSLSHGLERSCRADAERDLATLKRRVFGVGFGFLLVLALLCLVVFRAEPVLPAAIAPWAQIVAAAGIFAFVFLYATPALGYINAKHPKLLRRAILARKHCLWCKYDISSLEAASDGCTVCPECGAAWRLPGGAGDA